MRIKNINGTSNNSCKCSGWLDHWKKYGRQSVPTYCPEASCTQNPEVGAHVQKEWDNTWYILPLCKSHNMATGTINVSDNVVLVAANVSETCGKAAFGTAGGLARSLYR
jgi:hypothetical protein